MNERIKELYEECSNSVYAKTDGYGNDHYRRVTNYEKFAELIVRECAEVGLDSVEDGDDIDAIMKRVHNNILKHFGVEQ